MKLRKEHFIQEPKPEIKDFEVTPSERGLDWGYIPSDSDTPRFYNKSVFRKALQEWEERNQKVFFKGWQGIGADCLTKEGAGSILFKENIACSMVISGTLCENYKGISLKLFKMICRDSGVEL